MLYRDGVGSGPIEAVQDVFGKLWKRFRYPAEVGEIIRGAMNCASGERSIKEDNRAPINYRILADADMAEVKAAIRSTGARNRPDAGFWYEVHTD